MKNFYQHSYSAFQQIKNLISQNKKIIILGHINPDGDSVGSQMALLQSLQKKYPQKQICAPFAESKYLKFLLPKNYQNEITNEQLQDSLFILVDVGSIKRLAIKINQQAKIIKIDHHPEKEKLGNISWVDVASPSVCEMIYFLLDFWEFPFDQGISTALLTGMITDSGNFQFNKTRSQSFWVASQLMEKGAKLNIIHHHLEKKTNKDFKIINYILENFNQEGSFIYFQFMPQDIKKLPFLKTAEDIKKFINLFQYLEGVKIWSFFVQTATDSQIHCSLRSEGLVINQIAEKYGGGGHENASGIKLDKWNVVQNLIADLKQIANND